MEFTDEPEYEDDPVIEEEEGAEDLDPDREGNFVYPPHMWKGVAMWLGDIYGIINLITIVIAFR